MTVVDLVTLKSGRRRSAVGLNHPLVSPCQADSSPQSELEFDSIQRAKMVTAAEMRLSRGR